MSEQVIKPEKKQKKDGSVEYLTSDECRFLVMRGDYTGDEILDAAIKSNLISPDEREDWLSSCSLHQDWYKPSPIGGQQGYSIWHHPVGLPCRGAYFASTLQWD